MTLVYDRVNMRNDLHSLLTRLMQARRILVLGSSGSGKTTLSRRVGQRLGIETIHLDAHFWRPGWLSTPQDQWRDVVAHLIQRKSWVMDGTYESTLDLRIPAADFLIHIDQNRLTCLWRIVKRKITIDDDHRPDAPPGQPIDRAFLRYVWQYPKMTHPVVMDCVRRYGPDKPLIRLKGSARVHQFVDQLDRCIQATSPSDHQE